VKVHRRWGDSNADLIIEAPSLDPIRGLRERSLGLMTALANEEPTSWQYAHRRSLAMVRLGDVDWMEGDAQATRRRYQEAMEVQERLVNGEITDRVLLDDLGWSCLRIANLDYVAGRPEVALQLIDRQIAIAHQLKAGDRAAPSPYWSLMTAHNQAATVLEWTPRRAEYESHLTKALDAAERLIQIRPDERRYHAHYAELAVEVASKIELPADRLPNASALAQQARISVEVLKKVDPESHEALATEGYLTALLALIEEQMGHFPEALRLAEESVKLARRLNEFEHDSGFSRYRIQYTNECLERIRARSLAAGERK